MPDLGSLVSVSAVFARVEELEAHLERTQKRFNMLKRLKALRRARCELLGSIAAIDRELEQLRELAAPDSLTPP